MVWSREDRRSIETGMVDVAEENTEICNATQTKAQWEPNSSVPY